MADLTPNQRRALAFRRAVWEMQEGQRDAQAQAAENDRAARAGVAPARMATFVERGDVRSAFDSGMRAMAEFDRHTIRRPDGSINEVVTFAKIDADAAGGKIAQIYGLLSNEARLLWDEVFGPVR
jgi:hypothetical protein